MRGATLLRAGRCEPALYAQLLARVTQLPVGQVVMSSVTLAELEYGVHRKGQPVRLRNALTQVLLRMDVLPWDKEVATCYGKFCSTLKAQGVFKRKLMDAGMAHLVKVDSAGTHNYHPGIRPDVSGDRRVFLIGDWN